MPPDIEENEEIIDEVEDESPSGGSKIVVWLVIFGLAVLFLPLYIISTTVKSTNEKLSTGLEDVQAVLSATPAVPPAQQTLSAQFLSLQKQSQAAGSVSSTLIASYINWPTIMAAVGAYDPNQMNVNSVTQIVNGIRITGRAQQETIAMAYADMLRASGLFDVVAVESITLQSIMITATPMPTATPQPSVTPVPTTAPSGRTQQSALTPMPTIELKVTDFIISVTIKKASAANGRST